MRDMRAIALVAALIAGASTTSVLAAQDQAGKANIERGLAANYMPTKLAGVGDRLRFTQLGTVLVIQVDGMAASPVTEFAFGNNYKDGRIKRSLAGACSSPGARASSVHTWRGGWSGSVRKCRWSTA